MSWSLLLAGLASIATAVPLAGTLAVANQPPAQVLKLQSAPNEELTVDVVIGGQGPFRFMVDTGSQATIVSTALADRLMLDTGHAATLVGMASSEPVRTASIPEFSLGDRSFPIRLAPIVEPENIGDADGILGIDSLQGQRVLLDFRKKQIAVADARNLGGDRGFDIIVKAHRKLGQLIITHASVDGVRTAVLVDTGSPGSVGNPALLRKLAADRPTGGTRMIDVNGNAVSGRTLEGQRLEIGRASINNFPITFADSPLFRVLGLTDEPALVLGMGELKLFKRVAIDFEQRRVLFDVPAQPGDERSFLGAP